MTGLTMSFIDSLPVGLLPILSTLSTNRHDVGNERDALCTPCWLECRVGIRRNACDVGVESK